MEKKIKIEITERDAELFIWFRRYQKIWEKTKELRPGSLVLHFDEHNKIRKKEFHFIEKVISS